MDQTQQKPEPKKLPSKQFPWLWIIFGVVVIFSVIYFFWILPGQTNIISQNSPLPSSTSISTNKDLENLSKDLSNLDDNFNKIDTIDTSLDNIPTL